MDFGDAYERHIWDVYGFLAYRTRSAPEAEDLTQETFEKALRAWDSFDPERAQRKTWLLAIARNVYIDSQRRRAARPLAVGDAGLDELVGEDGSQAVVGPDPAIAQALRRLERREREAIALRFGGDLRTAEIAELLGVTVSNAQQILSRSLRRLRKILEADGYGGGEHEERTNPVSRADRP